MFHHRRAFYSIFKDLCVVLTKLGASLTLNFIFLQYSIYISDKFCYTAYRIQTKRIGEIFKRLREAGKIYSQCCSLAVSKTFFMEKNGND